jgi:hypothetical protein
MNGALWAQDLLCAIAVFKLMAALWRDATGRRRP